MPLQQHGDEKVHMKLSEYAFINEMTRLLDKNPDISFENLKSVIEERLISVGLRKEIVDQLINSYFKDEKLSEVLKFKGALNPRFLCEKTGKKFWFYIVDARYGKYLPLIAITKRWEGDLSSYVIYGPQDTIFRLHGTEDETRIMYEALNEANYLFEVIEVESIPYFYRNVVTESNETSVSESILRKLVLDYRDKDISDELKKDLISKNILLGPTIVEDLSITNRIKAFVGVTFVGLVPYEFRREFLDRLLKNNEVKKCLLSVYKCKGAGYAYLLEVITNYPVELDELTDAIAEMLRGQVETSTFIAAKANERMPMFSRKDSLNLRGITYDALVDYVRDVESHFVPHLDRNETLCYSKLTSKERHVLLNFMDKLTEFEFSSLEQPDQDLIKESVQNFAEGFILKDCPKLYNSANLSYTVIEKISREALEKLVNLFYMGNFKRAQAEIPLPSKNIAKFTLGQCYSSFDRWNKSPFSKFIKFPADILTSMSNFIGVRNPISHGEIPASWSGDFGIMSRAVGEALIDGLKTAFWLMKNLLDRDEWVIPIEDALNISENILKKSERTGEKLKEILERTKKTEEISQQTYDLLSFMFADFNKTKSLLFGKLDEIVEASQKKNAEQAFNKIITAVDQGDTQSLNGVLKAIVSNSNDIIENSDRSPSSRGRATWLIEIIKRTAYSLPSDTAGNIIAQIILNASLKYIPILLGIFSSLLP